MEMVHSIMRHAALPFTTSPYSPLRSVRSDHFSEYSLSKHGDLSVVLSQSHLEERNRSMSMASDTDSEIAPIGMGFAGPEGIAFQHPNAFVRPHYHRSSFSHNAADLLSVEVDLENDHHTVGTSITSSSSIRPSADGFSRRKIIPRRIRKAASRVLRLVQVSRKSKGDSEDSGSASLRAMTL